MKEQPCEQPRKLTSLADRLIAESEARRRNGRPTPTPRNQPTKKRDERHRFYIRMPKKAARELSADCNRNGVTVTEVVLKLVEIHMAEDPTIRDLRYLGLPKRSRGVQPIL